jgi:hypothetical protein
MPSSRIYRKRPRRRPSFLRHFQPKFANNLFIGFDQESHLPNCESKRCTMTIRFVQLSALALALTVLISIRPAIADGLLPDIFSSNKTDTQKAPPKASKSEPSTISKMGTSTKKFFTNIGDTLTFKKSAPPQKTMPTNPYIKPPKEESKPSLLTSWFNKEEPKKPKTANEWLEQKRLDP